MKKVFLYTILFLFGLQMTKAQVKDISLTVTPTANYTWWDKQVSLKNGPMVGGMVGFGLGRYVELRGVYEQSLDLKNTLEDLNAPSDLVGKFEERKVDVVRWGGEFKGNIPTGAGFAPYLTLGSGVQSLKMNDLKNEQIYLSAGLGTKINLSDRVTLNLEGKCHAFNLNQGSLLREANPNNDKFNEWVDKNITDERMLNWSANAGLQIYLGGRTPNSYTALDRAYERQFSSGFKGMRLVLEPGGAYINFDDATNFKNTYLLGGAVGFDFTDFVGLRAFYYQATKDEKISTDFDNLAIYGGDFIAKLNVARGIVPYLTIGGGYMNAYDSYEGAMAKLPVKSGYFAKGGLGLSIPLAKYFELFGAANLLYSTGSKEPQNLQTPDELKQHMMYNVGLKFNLGSSANPDKALNRYMRNNMNDDSMMYEERIKELREELNMAYETNDSLRAARVLKEKQRLSKEIEKAKRANSKEDDDRYYQSEEPLVRLSPKELESLVDKVVEGVEKEQNKKETTDERIDRIERLLIESNRGVYPQQNFVPQNVQSSNNDLMNELQRINNKIDANAQKIDNMMYLKGQQGEDKTIIVAPGTQTPVAPATSATVTPDDATNNVITDKTTAETPSSWIIYKGISPIVGFNFGERASALLGIKANYAFSSTNFIFTPDLYFGVGGKSSYGINANVIYPILSVDKFSPYVGAGLGLNKVDDFNFGVNLIAGTYLNVGNGSLFVDYTSRRFFKNNQFTVGYRIDF